MEGRSGDEQPHLPPPTLWPVGFAVGIACLLVGTIVSWPAAGVGAAIAVVFGFLWIRDATRGYSHPPVGAEAEPEAPAVTAPAIPADHGEAAMPEPEPGERFPRSRFIEGATLGLGAVIGGAVTVPAAGLMLGSSFLGQGIEDVDVGPLDAFPQDKWMLVTFMLDPEEGEVTRRTVYVRNNGLVDGTPSFTIVSNRCVHLGCPVQPSGLVQDEETTRTEGGAELRTAEIVGLSGFGCPCHGGAYDPEGNPTAGPPVRALDRHQFSIRNGRLFLGKTYSVGRVEGAGANAKIERYHLAGPGQHVDDWQRWLYPVQPTQ